MVFKQLQQSKNDYAIAQQRLQEADRRLQEADRKYGGLISKEDTARELDAQIIVLSNRLRQLDSQAQAEERELSIKIGTLKSKLKELEEQEIVEAFGFYESKYDFQESEEYKHRLDKIRSQQKQMIKDKQAAVCRTEWSVNGSVKEGKKMTDDFIKLVLRAFNGECDAAVIKVKYNNVQTMENRIRKAYTELNKLSQTTHCEIVSQFLELKLQELWLTHEYQEKKYQEQEEQRIIRDQMREEAKALREWEKAKEDAEKEERLYQEALEKARRDAESATGKIQEKLFSQIQELQKRLAEAEANKQRAISQAQLTKSGYVYIISNIGSFGEDIYKIGMTRRLEPMDRVKELSSASVPFPFDVHAMIFCENAPELESRLHRYFDNTRMNKANEKKEFFRVSLQEIVDAVREIDKELHICKSEVKFTKVAEAADYRKTLAKERTEIS
ncbi:ATPase [Planktothricoides sp. SR001]|nr:ATPase [Planktothricoides sp. SR001]